jgi:DNA replication protein DnaC
MSTYSAQQLANKLRCFGIAHHLESRIAYANQTNATYEDFIRQLFEDELQERRQKTAAKMISRAKFRHNHVLEDWDSTYERGINKRTLTDLSKLHFFNNRENLVILGSTGSGKSHLAISLGRLLCNSETSVKFFSTHQLFEEIQAQRAAGRYLSFLRQTAKSGAIILDDFGLRNYSHDEATSLMELLEEVHQKGVIIITSQVRPEGWRSLFEDQVIGDAIIDRLSNPSKIIELKGESYRKKLIKPGVNKLDEEDKKR